jgi:hypothetical protein
MKSLGMMATMLTMGAMAAIALPASAQPQPPSPGNEQAYWVYIKDKGGIVAMYPSSGRTPDGRGWATTDQFEQLISSPTDPSAAPTIIDRGGVGCAGPACPDGAVMRRLRDVPDFPAGTLVLRGTAVHAVFLEKQ